MTIQEVRVNKKPHRVRLLKRNGNTFLVEVNEKIATVRIKKPSQGKTVIIEINGRSFQAKIKRNQGNILQVKIDGKPFEVQSQLKIPKGTITELKPKTAVTRRPAKSLAFEHDVVTAPIAGRIILLKATIGQKVEKGECIFILEAMKMENEIASPKSGVVKEIMVFEGAFVNKGDVLAVIT